MKTKIIVINSQNAVSESVRILKKGGLVIYPTETSYGIGSDATNEKAIKKLIKLKGRRHTDAKGVIHVKPISIIVSSLLMIRKYGFLNEDAKKLSRMSGPLTLVIRKRKLPDILSEKTIAFRIPANRFALRLVKRYGRPVTATSANLSGRLPLYKIKDVKKIFDGKADLIIDAGNLAVRKPSTIYDTTSKNILRKGRIKEKDIIKCLET